MKHKVENISASEASSDEEETDFNPHNSQRSIKSQISEDSDDEDSRSLPSQKDNSKSVAPDLLEQFERENPDLSRMAPIEDNFSDDDEIYMLSVPKMINSSSLLQKPINLDDVTKLKISDTKYLIEAIDEAPDAINVLSTNLRILKPIRKFCVREYIKKKRKVKGLEEESFQSSIPETLKQRHPLFGANYQEKLVLDDSVKDKLDDVTATSYEEPKKHKKKKKKRVKDESFNLEGMFTEQPQSETKEESIFTLLEAHSKKERKKKKKSIAQPDNAETGEVTLEDILMAVSQHNLKEETPEKKTKVGVDSKRHKFKQEVVENALEEELTATLESPKKKKKKREDKSLVNESVKSKIKKEKSSVVTQNGFTVTEFSENKAEVDGKHGTMKKKKSKYETDEEGTPGSMKSKLKSNAILNSTVIPALQLPVFECDLSGIIKKEKLDEEMTPVSKKSKKERKASVSLGAAMRADDSVWDIKPKIKKAERHSLARELVEPKVKMEYLSEVEGSPKKKKRKIKQEKPESGDEKSSLISSLLKKVKREIVA